MRDHTLFCTYLNDLLWQRRLSPEHLADRLGHANPTEVRSWLNGWSTPRIEYLRSLAAALDADPVVMTLGWLVDGNPEHEEAIRRTASTSLETFPKSGDLTLHMPRPRRDMTVDDPHDAREPSALPAPRGAIRRRSAAARPV